MDSVKFPKLPKGWYRLPDKDIALDLREVTYVAPNETNVRLVVSGVERTIGFDNADRCDAVAYDLLTRIARLPLQVVES